MADEIKTDEALVAELEEMFGSEASGSEESGTESETEPETEPEDTHTEEPTGDEGESEGNEPANEPEGNSNTQAEDKQRAKQNYAFAEMRTQNKKLSNLISKLGTVLGLDEKTPVDEIADKVQSVLLQKESKDSNIPVEYLQRMQALEVIAQDATRVKREKEVSDNLTSLSEKYNLSKEQLTEFATQLAADGKNPLEVDNVDIESEYLKRHQQDLIQAAVAKALADEKARLAKADNHAGGKGPSGAGSGDEGGSKIKTVAELSKALDSLE